MPLPLLAALAPFLGDAFNAINQGVTNRANRNFSVNMYNRQRSDSLSDWNMMNDYNSPANQMKRFKEAGLNPNLIYGHATNASASMPRQSNAPNANAESPKVNVGNSLAMVYDIEGRKLANENLVLTGKNIQADTDLKNSQNPNVQARTEGQIIKNKYDAATNPIRYEAQKLDVEKTVQEINQIKESTKATGDENARRQKLQPFTIAHLVQQMLTLAKGRAKTDADIDHINRQIQALDYDIMIKDYDWRMLNDKGITTKDSGILRAVINVINKFKDDILSTGIQEGYKSLGNINIIEEIKKILEGK